MGLPPPARAADRLLARNVHGLHDDRVAAALSERLELLESQPVEIGGVRFGVANIWERDFLDASGAQRRGLSAQLMFEDDHDEFVGEGSTVRLGESTWSVSEVRPGPPRAALVLVRVA